MVNINKEKNKVLSIILTISIYSLCLHNDY